MTEIQTKHLGMTFSTDLVPPVMSGAKTQTRRLITGDPQFFGGGGKDGPEWNDPWHWGWVTEDGEVVTLMPLPQESDMYLRPRYKPGSVVYVKETWKPLGGAAVAYRADKEHAGEFLWESARFMPRWAARTWLRITAARVERLQAITEADAQAEGFGSVDEFREKWDKLNREQPWDANPWAWVYTFEKCEVPT